ncbi:MAG: hypothetical protein SGJ27_24895 [Candidatus Melainabacteria bacterium]|nr:hypothetical protein [Candidatus Melainabacteria bacterium]
MPETNNPVSLQFELPNSSLSIGDLVGRAARFVPANFKFVFKLYLSAVTIYVLGWELLLYIAEYLWTPLESGNSATPFDIRIPLLIACLLIIWFCVWWLRVKTLTLWLLMTGEETNLDTAAARARDFRMLWIYLPTIGIELTEAIWSSLLLIFINHIETTESVADTMQATGSYIVLVVLWVLPFRMLAILNLFPAYNALVSERSIKQGFAKFWFHCRRAPMLVIFVTFLTAIVINCLELPIMITAIAEGTLQALGILNKDAIKILTLIPRLVMEIMIGTASSGIFAVVAVLFDNELKIRLEGRDLTSTLKEFELKRG